MKKYYNNNTYRGSNPHAVAELASSDQYPAMKKYDNTTYSRSKSNPHAAAATAIQAAYRGHLVRKTQPLKHLRTIRSVREELQSRNHQLNSNPRLLHTLSRDPTERLKWSEGAMALLLQLDSMQGVHPVVRNYRKSLARGVIQYQERIDAAGRGEAHVPDVAPPGGQGPPRDRPNPFMHGQQTHLSSGSFDNFYISTPQGGNPSPNNAYVPNAPTASGRPASQFPVPPEQGYYPSAQGHPRHEYIPRFPPGTEPDVIDFFMRADRDGSGAIELRELQTVLSLNFFNFSRRTVRIMLYLFADNPTVNSRLGPEAFAKLWKELRQWQRTFKTFDTDGSGNIDQWELREALRSLGIGATPQVLQLLMLNYDRTGHNASIAFGEFIECGLIMKGLVDQFKLHDPHLTGAATLEFQAYLMMVLPFIVA